MSASVQDARYCTGLASVLLYRYRRLGELSDLGGAISTLRDAVGLTRASSNG